MPDPILISSFSHKGGVGKTTSIHNIAAVLTKQFGLRVLLIDADSQGNLTSVAMHKKFRHLAQQYMPENDSEHSEIELNEKDLSSLPAEEKSAEEAEWGEEYFYTQTVKGKRRTVYECLETPRNRFSDLVSIDEINKRVDDTVLQHLDEYGNLFFLPGDVNIHQLEEPIANAFSLGTMDRFVPWAPYPRVLTRFFIELGKKYNIDIVLIDLNPAVSAWNRAIVMGSHYFTITTLPDLYSRRAIFSTTTVLSNWIESLPILQEAVSDPNFKMPPPPKHLGYLCNRVKIRKPPKSDRAAPTITQQKKIKALQTTVQSKLLSIDSIVTSNYRLLPPPLIKEFTRAGGEGPESGAPVAYLFYDELTDKESIKKSEVNQSQEYYLNAYYAAVIGIFRGLSDDHHSQLNDKLRLAPNQSEYQILNIEYGLGAATPSKKKRTSSQSTTRRKIPLLQGVLEDQQPINFREIANQGGGNCALYAMNITREALCHSLQDFFNQEQNWFGNVISSEIADALEAKHFKDQNNQYNLLILNRTRIQEIYEKLQQKLMEKHQGIFEDKSEEEKLTIATSLGGDDSLARSYLTAHRNWQNTENDIKVFLTKPETAQRYINALKEDKFWVGTRTLVLYAYQEKINLQIWRKKSETGMLEMMKIRHHPEALIKAPIDILYQGGCHFTRLEKVAPSATHQSSNNSSQSSTKSQRSLSPRMPSQRFFPEEPPLKRIQVESDEEQNTPIPLPQRSINLKRTTSNRKQK